MTGEDEEPRLRDQWPGFAWAGLVLLVIVTGVVALCLAHSELIRW